MLLVIETVLIWTELYCIYNHKIAVCTARRGSRRAFKFALSCFELTDITSNIYHRRADNVVIWSLSGPVWRSSSRREWRLTDQTKGGENLPDACRI